MSVRAYDRQGRVRLDPALPDARYSPALTGFRTAVNRGQVLTLPADCLDRPRRGAYSRARLGTALFFGRTWNIARLTPGAIRGSSRIRGIVLPTGHRDFPRTGSEDSRPFATMTRRIIVRMLHPPAHCPIRENTGEPGECAFFRPTIRAAILKERILAEFQCSITSLSTRFPSRKQIR